MLADHAPQPAATPSPTRLVARILGARLLALVQRRLAVLAFVDRFIAVVAFIAIRTVHRVDLGPVAVAVWVAILTLIGVVLFLVVGTLFGQGGLIGTGLGRRVIFVPITNMALSFVVAPLVNRLISREHRGVL